MTHEELLAAPDGIVQTIIDQGEKRLASQCAFADTQDARGGNLLNASVGLAAASVAVCAASASASGLYDPLTVGAFIATVGFGGAAGIALWAARSCNFDSAGWFPNDFAHDVSAKRTLQELQSDFVFDLQIRLSRNRNILIWRGRRFNEATLVMLATPFVALIGAVMAA